MTGQALSEDLWTAAERARLAVLAREIEEVRTAARTVAHDEFHGLGPIERPLDWSLLGQVATEVARLLQRAGVLETEDVRRVAGPLAGPPALATLIAWGTGHLRPAPFECAALAWAVVRLALPPFLRGRRDDLSMDASERGTCPECRGAPDLAILDPARGARLLICATCDAHWRFDRVRCPCCGNVTGETLATLAGGPRGYSIRACDQCGSYLKTIDRRLRAGAEAPLLLRMLTVEMDLAAQEAGYHPGAAA
ncbi:MAG: formate dehydrogenase accessory protein FdhE [Chloroflexota bacterium]|nr:formate dehydrogenase accessory protein FdhE [Chloroflexota bacterium]